MSSSCFSLPQSCSAITCISFSTINSQATSRLIPPLALASVLLSSSVSFITHISFLFIRLYHPKPRGHRALKISHVSASSGNTLGYSGNTVGYSGNICDTMRHFKTTGLNKSLLLSAHRSAGLIPLNPRKKFSFIILLYPSSGLIRTLILQKVLIHHSVLPIIGLNPYTNPAKSSHSSSFCSNRHDVTLISSHSSFCVRGLNEMLHA